jgi:hypothetical protein
MTAHLLKDSSSDEITFVILAASFENAFLKINKR